MRRIALVPMIAAVGLLAAACGSSSETASPVEGEPAIIETGSTNGVGAAVPAWVERVLADAGPDVALVFSTSDYAPGSNRVGFLVVRDDGSLVEAPGATVWVGSENASEPQKTSATLEPIGTEASASQAEGDPTQLYVANVELPAPGRYWLAVQPEGEEIQAVGAVDVRSQTLSPAVGSRAIPSDNPTLDDAPAEQITTATPPDTELLRSSIADAVRDGVPFVVAFATPKYCQSRTCGPTVDVVDEVRKRLADSDVRFIHVEIYEGNDPSKGVNRWVEEWGLPTEPWVFLVEADGVIQKKFEGSVSVDELEQAVRSTLL